MKMETGFGDLVDEEGRALRRRRIILVSAICAVVVIVAAFVLAHRGGKAKAAPDAAPSVTVIVPRRQSVASTVSATGPRTS